MEFCPKCEVRLKNDNGLLSCPKCKYVKEKPDKSIKEKPEEINSEFL
jgi:DNA-directed RNA polymerase subunit M/transcription elongation factor TFIIS